MADNKTFKYNYVEFEDAATSNRVKVLDGYVIQSNVPVGTVDQDFAYMYIYTNTGQPAKVAITDIANISATTEFIVSKPAGSYKAGDTFPAGMSLANAFKSLLTEIYAATFQNASTAASLNIAGLREVGEIVTSFVITNTFNQGLIKGGYTGVIWDPNKSMGPAAGLPTKHTIDGTVYNVTSLSQQKAIPNYVIQLGVTSFATRTDYSAGSIPKNSAGENQSAYPAGFVTGSTSIQGIYPYFYGYINDNQTIADVSLASLTKVIAQSTDTISIAYSNVVGKKLVVVIPSTSATKTKWYVNALNNGSINKPGDLFAMSTKNFDSPTGLWSALPCKVYISTPTSINETIQLQN
jgi:hypothetical protein